VSSKEPSVDSKNPRNSGRISLPAISLNESFQFETEDSNNNRVDLTGDHKSVDASHGVSSRAGVTKVSSGKSLFNLLGSMSESNDSHGQSVSVIPLNKYVNPKEKKLANNIRSFKNDILAEAMVFGGAKYLENKLNAECSSSCT
jgi:hypothetical protein